MIKKLIIIINDNETNNVLQNSNKTDLKTRYLTDEINKITYPRVLMKPLTPPSANKEMMSPI